MPLKRNILEELENTLAAPAKRTCARHESGSSRHADLDSGLDQLPGVPGPSYDTYSEKMRLLKGVGRWEAFLYTSNSFRSHELIRSVFGPDFKPEMTDYTVARNSLLDLLKNFKKSVMVRMEVGYSSISENRANDIQRHVEQIFAQAEAGGQAYTSIKDEARSAWWLGNVRKRLCKSSQCRNALWRECYLSGIRLSRLRSFLPTKDASNLLKEQKQQWTNKHMRHIRQEQRKLSFHQHRLVGEVSVYRRLWACCWATNGREG